MRDYEFSRIQREPAYRKVFDAIEREIMTGRLKVGDHLPTESILAEQFGVNRSTVREGIRLLEQGGLVERDGGKRPRISVPHYLDLASSASRALVLHSVTFRELWQASMLIEPAMAEMACGVIGAAGMAELAENLARMEAAVVALEGEDHRPREDVDDFVGLDREFHEILARHSANRVLALAHEPITSLFIPTGRLILPQLGTYRRVMDAHRFIYDALTARDAAKARSWMWKHMDDFRRAYELAGRSLDIPILDAIDAEELNIF